jgi:hypothetical protein
MMYVDFSTPDTLNLRGLLLQQLLGNCREALGVSRSRSDECDVIRSHLDQIQDVMSQVFHCVQSLALGRYKQRDRGNYSGEIILVDIVFVDCIWKTLLSKYKITAVMRIISS